jgi:Asp-tRNA(Asn)/Glu-tRNA(Gln) amidotransferase A subunit family amidase
MKQELYRLPATAAAAAIREGHFSSEDLVTSCLERIEAVDADIEAWAHLDPAHALMQARLADEARQFGRPLGPLHGVPVGIKDIIDTADLPTEEGTVLHAGRQPDEDAYVVSRLRAAGAVILGKTVTTELAVFHPGKTRNPHNPAHTPGGSSSGSAAAVAAEMVPLALGTQTNGSMIRPASYCGVVGYKPTFGLIPRVGVLEQSPPLDQLGVFARTVEDVALVAEQLIGYDARDPDTRPRARPPLLATARQEPPMPPRLAFVKSPVWDQAEADTQAAFAQLVEFLGPERIEEIDLGAGLNDVVEWHRSVMEADLARSFAREYEVGGDRLSAVLRGMIERGQQVTAVAYNDAVRRVPRINELLDDAFVEFDAILTPATTGPAPAGLDATGSPIFCTLWTYLGTPAISLPLLQGGDGLPLGVQLVSARHDDARLLRNARWLAGLLQDGGDDTQAGA